MRRKSNPFIEKSLIASRNGVRILATQRVEATIPDVRFDFGNGDFTISVCANLGSIAGDTFNITNTSLAPIPEIKITTTSCVLTSNIGVTTNIPFTQTLLVNRLYRFIIIRQGVNVNVYINNRIDSTGTVLIGATFNFYDVGLNGKITLGLNYINGILSNAFILKQSLSLRQLEEIHQTNILPKDIHVNALCHYPLNHNLGNKAYDVVEQYNYAKVTPLVKVHADLINYTSDEVGITNPLIQNAWQNIYSKKKEGNNFLKLNAVNGYSEILALQNNTSLNNQFIIAFSFVPPKSIPVGVGDFSPIFINKISAGLPSLFGFYLSPTPSFISIVTFDFDDTNSIGDAGISVDNVIPNNVTTEIGIVNVVYFSWVDAGVRRTRMILQMPNGTIHLSAQGGGGSLVKFNYVWQNFLFNRDTAFTGQYGKHFLGKFVLINNYAKLLDVNDSRELRILLNIDKSTDYKGLGNTLIDIDFGDIFLDTGNYFARDNSGNIRHARLYNWTPVTDQPLMLEQHTGLPERTKALRFVKANSHYVSIPNFNPTKELGYTKIVGFALESDRVFNASYDDIFFSKRDVGGLPSKIIYGEASTKIIAIIENVPSGFGGNSNLNINTDISKINFVCEQNRDNISPILQVNNRRFFNTNQYGVNNDNGNNLIYGYNEIGNNDLFLGWDGPAAPTRRLDGYISFVGVWKGWLSKSEIFDIINNKLGANATSKVMSNCQLYLTFDRIINDGGIFKIKDWSPQNRTVTLNNYTLAEITPGDPSYRLVDINTLI